MFQGEELDENGSSDIDDDFEEEVPQVHHSWSSLDPHPLTPHEGHGRGHNAFAVAISAGIVGGGARKTRRKKTCRIGILGLSRAIMVIVARFLSSAAGARPDRHRNCAPQTVQCLATHCFGYIFLPPVTR